MQPIENITENKVLPTKKYLWLLMLSYSMVYIMSNIYDPRLIKIFNMYSSGGVLIFPITYMLSDLITEVYGYKFARKTIWCGFVFNLLFILYGYMVSHLFTPLDQNTAYLNQAMSFDLRIIFASGFSYLVAEPFNSYIMAKMKVMSNGQYVGIRFVASTFIAAAIDTTIFNVIGFYHTMTNGQLLEFIFYSWVIKVCVELIGLPISIRLAKKIKRLEHMDIYDRRTNFNFFNLNTRYLKKDNEYGKHDA